MEHHETLLRSVGTSTSVGPFKWGGVLPLTGAVGLSGEIPITKVMGDDFDAEETRSFLQNYIDQHGLLSFIDLTVESLGPDEMVLRVPFDESLVNRDPGNGSVHGGVAATLIDTAGGLSVLSTMADPPNANVATTDLNVSYLRPTRGDLIATAEVLRTGSTVGVATVDVESTVPSGGRDLVAVGRGTYRVLRSEN
nr:PaaI family thioesterase [Halanaeroarchaeum sulfurireducens]